MLLIPFEFHVTSSSAFQRSPRRCEVILTKAFQILHTAQIPASQTCASKRRSCCGRSSRDGTQADNQYTKSPSRKHANREELVRVKLSVPYRVHDRQILCVGGSYLPLGWSFLSIATVPLEWALGDVWSTEFELPAATRVEYKYVILEEQGWTRQVSRDSEGLVSYSYRMEPEMPLDVQQIQKQMAIVAWQPGPNRFIQTPFKEELISLQAGEMRYRESARAAKLSTHAPSRVQAKVGNVSGPDLPDLSSTKDFKELIEEEERTNGTFEKLYRNYNGHAVLERRDVWKL